MMDPSKYKGTNSRSAYTYGLSKNTLVEQPKQKKVQRNKNYGNREGRSGPKVDFDAPITNHTPLAVTDYRQLMMNTRDNKIPNEKGVTNLPMQQIQPPAGGKYSGRTMYL